jgi:hypothetical protein
VTDRRLRGHIERRKGDRRKQQLPFEGPERRRGKDRRRFVRRVMSGQEPLPEEERDLR